jgi:hypothetical protein
MAPREIDQLFQCAMAQLRVGGMRDRFGLHRAVYHPDPFEIAGCQRAVLCATDMLSWISATSGSPLSRWRRCVSDERSNGSLWQKLSSPQKNW